MKTQYLFRINKGKEELSESINSYMPEENRPIPFNHIIYVGDGLTDVPAMNVTKKNGGYAIAVYKPRDRKGKNTCKELLEAGRVHFISKADYTADSNLVSTIKMLLVLIANNIRFEDYRKWAYQHHLKG